MFDHCWGKNDIKKMTMYGREIPEVLNLTPENE